MDADLLGLKTSPRAPHKGAAQGSGKEELPVSPQPAAPLTAHEKGEWDTASDPRLWRWKVLGRELSCPGALSAWDGGQGLTVYVSVHGGRGMRQASSDGCPRPSAPSGSSWSSHLRPLESFVVARAAPRPMSLECLCLCLCLGRELQTVCPPEACVRTGRFRHRPWLSPRPAPELGEVRAAPARPRP